MKHPTKKTRITASVIGVLLGLSGALNHGLFEVLQGFKPTNGFFIEAISESHRFWIHGTEAAFTVVHNYLITGILAIAAGLAVMVWSVKFLDKKHGATIFLGLLIMLTLVGGGIGYILLIIPTWAFATLINKSPGWWMNKFSIRLRNLLSSFWIYSLLATAICWLMVMQIGIFGYFPGQNDPDAILSIVFVFLFASVILAVLSFICAIAGDIKIADTNKRTVIYRRPVGGNPEINRAVL